MIRAKKQKRNKCICQNCDYVIPINPHTVKEKTIDDIIAVYVECPVCGERILKQLDTEETQQEAQRGVKLRMLQDKGKKLSDSQKKRLQSIEKELYNKRLKLNSSHWDEIYQSLNQLEDDQTGTAHLEPIQGNTGTLLRPKTSGERMVEHEQVL